MNASGLLLGVLFVAIWASAFTAIKPVIQEWPPLWALAVRFLCVVPILSAVVLWRGARWPGREDALRLAAMGVFGTAGYLGCAWLAAGHMATGIVALVSATAPLFVALGEVVVFRKKLPALAWLGLFLGWAGVAVLGLGRAAGGAAPEQVGLLLALGGAVSQATGILCFAPARGRLDAWTANLGQAAMASVVLLLLANGLEGGLPGPLSPLALAVLAWSILGVGIGGYALYFIMLRLLPPSTAAALQLAAPPLAAVFGWALLGEVLAWTDVLGGVVTLAGLGVLLGTKRA